MHSISERARFAGLTLTLALTGCAPALAQRAADAPYMDASLPVEQRVEDLLGRMTLEEKVAQMMALWEGRATITDESGRFDPTGASEWFRIGIGRIERAGEGRGAREHAEYVNAIQRWVVDNTRLGIPVLFHEEALHGLMAPEATSFPQSIALASTWDPALVERIFGITAREVRARGGQQVLSPVVDVARDPRWGRIEETYGEDPYLAGRMGVAAVRGFQGERPVGPDHVFATLKHLAGHGQPESGTNIGPAHLGERMLRDVFLHPFKMVVVQTDPASVMASYNEIDGVPSHINEWMLEEVLREEWGFDEVIVSDWFAIDELISRHRITDSQAVAARLALEATVDLELPDASAYPTLVDQVRQGIVPKSAIDAAVRRLLRAKLEIGLFEDPFVDPDRAARISGSAGHREVALEAARKAVTLLKNEPALLPLSTDGLERVAVIGPHAGEIMLGGYSGVPVHGVSILDGIRARVGPGVEVVYSEGVRLTEDSVFTDEPQPHLSGSRSALRWNTDAVVVPDSATNARRIEAAVAVAGDVDVALLVLGDNAMTSREGWAETHLGDRSRLDLPGPQEELIRRVLATGTPTVLVLQNGRPPAIPEVVETVPSILEIWYGGQEAGTAVAEALFGDLNPGGKLPVTIPRDVGQLPLFYAKKPSAARGYLFDTTDPLFPFGFGLSYTDFEYGAPTVTPDAIGPTGVVTVAVDVTNVGERAGDEVVQLYIRDLLSRVTRPVQQLRGFERVSLAPGETRTVRFRLGPDELEYTGVDMEPVVEPGTFEACTGGSSAHVQCTPFEVVDRSGGGAGP